MVDASPEWVCSISQSSNIVEPLPLNYHEHLDKQYLYTLDIVAQSAIPRTVTLHQKVVNSAGVEFTDVSGTRSKIVFYQVSIAEVWATEASLAGQNTFRFARQVSKLGGAPAPPIAVSTFTAYAQPNQQGDVEILVEFADFDPSLFSVE